MQKDYVNIKNSDTLVLNVVRVFATMEYRELPVRYAARTNAPMDDNVINASIVDFYGVKAVSFSW